MSNQFTQQHKQELEEVLKKLTTRYIARLQLTEENQEKEEIKNEFWKAVDEKCSYKKKDGVKLCCFSDQPMWNPYKGYWSICFMVDTFYNSEVEISTELIKEDDMELHEEIQHHNNNLVLNQQLQDLYG